MSTYNTVFETFRLSLGDVVQVWEQIVLQREA